MISATLLNSINAFSNGFEKPNLLMLGFSLSEMPSLCEKFRSVYAVTGNMDTFNDARNAFKKFNNLTILHGDVHRAPANNYHVVVFGQSGHEAYVRRDTMVMLKKNFMNQPFIFVYLGYNNPEYKGVKEFVDNYFKDIKVPIADGEACAVYLTEQKKEEINKRLIDESI